MPESESSPIRLSVSEAAKFLGVSTRTIRRAILSGTVEYIVVQERYKITLGSLLLWAKSTVTVKNKLQKVGFGKYVEKWKE
jgi:excisionase family DNA binding protein